MTTTYDVLLNPTTGDLPINPVLSNDINKVAQSGCIATKLHRGEALFNKSVGLPYLEWGQQKPFRISEVGDYVKRVILRLDGVVRISSWEESFDPLTRKAIINGRIVVRDESEFSISVLPSGDSMGNTNPVSYFVINGLPVIYGGSI